MLEFSFHELVCSNCGRQHNFALQSLTSENIKSKEISYAIKHGWQFIDDKYLCIYCRKV